MLPERPEWADVPIFLTAAEIRNPMPVIKGVFEDRSLGEIREALANQEAASLTSTSHFFAAPEQRGDLLYTNRQLLRLIEAIYALMQSCPAN